MNLNREGFRTIVRAWLEEEAILDGVPEPDDEEIDALYDRLNPNDEVDW